MRRGNMLVLSLAALVGACGARTTLSLDDDEDAAVIIRPRDGGPDGADAGRDAGVDAGRPDAGVPAVPCGRDADCREGLCGARPALRPADLAPLPLECGPPAAGAEVGERCDDRRECARGLCVVAGVCVRPCVSDADCDASELCRDVLVRTGDSAMQTLRACTARVAAPDGVRVAGPEPLAPIPGGGMSTATDAVPDLAPNALVLWTARPGTVPFIRRVRTRGASSTLVFDVFAPAPADGPDWGVGATTVSDVVTLLYPNGPNSPSAPMGFEVELAAERRTPSERILIRREGEGTRFDLEAYLVGGGGWEIPPGGGLPRSLERAVDQAREVLGGAGLSIGEVRAHEVVGMTRGRFAMLEGESGPLGVPDDLDDLYRLSAGANTPAVHVFFVRSIEGALGIASGIPGPHVLPGTGASGVAIAVDFIPLGEVGNVVAHEIGHYMGLFHTSELDGTANDPFPDTPVCGPGEDRDGDGFLLPEECGGTGADYLMFWAGAGATISDGQAELMRRAYFVE